MCYFGTMIGVDDQGPTYRALPLGVRVMIVGRQGLFLCCRNLAATAAAAINPRAGRYPSRPVFVIENLVFRLKDVATVLIECHVHRGAKPFPTDIRDPLDQKAC